MTMSASAAAAVKWRTFWEMPAAASTRSTSSASSSVSTSSRRRRRSAGPRAVSSSQPLAAGMTRTPAGPSTITSARRRSPRSTSWSESRGASPNSTSRFASPRSASSTHTRSPCRASATARLAVTLVFPTPPFPLATAITRRRASSPAAPAWVSIAVSLMAGLPPSCGQQAAREPVHARGTSSSEPRDALRRADDVGQADAELVVHHHRLAARDRLPVDEHVERLAGELLELDHRAGPELEQLADGEPRAPDLDRHLERDVEQQLEVAGRLAPRRLRRLRHEISSLGARRDAHRVAARLHAGGGQEARPPLHAHQDRPLAPGAQREHVARAQPEHVAQPHAMRAELGRDLQLDRRQRGAQAVAEAGPRRLALAAHARLEAMAQRIERRVRQAEPERRGGLPRDPDRQLEEHDQVLRPRDGGENRVRLRAQRAELDRRQRPDGLLQVMQHARAEALEHALLDRREIAPRDRRRPPGRAPTEHLQERRDERRRHHQEALPAQRRHAEDPEADRLRDARRHARELEELEAAHVEVRHLAEERAERGAQPAHETVHHQLEAREPAAQVALLAGEVEPLHAARRRAAAAGDGAFADAAQKGVDLLLGANTAPWTMNSVK